MFEAPFAIGVEVAEEQEVARSLVAFEIDGLLLGMFSELRLEAKLDSDKVGERMLFALLKLLPRRLLIISLSVRSCEMVFMLPAAFKASSRRVCSSISCCIRVVARILFKLLPLLRTFEAFRITWLGGDRRSVDGFFVELGDLNSAKPSSSESIDAEHGSLLTGGLSDRTEDLSEERSDDLSEDFSDRFRLIVESADELDEDK